MYAKFWKRFFDFVLSVMALIVLSPILLILIVVGAIAMKGNPFFVQPRPGKIGKDGREKIFYMVKLRTMANERNSQGELLPDEQRINRYGAWLRKTSCDELFSLLNIAAGSASLVGPRPWLVRDCIFFTKEQHRRHTVRPGLTGLAQVNGRNNISWAQRIALDLEYIDRGITLKGDLQILFATVGKVLKKSDITHDGTVSDIDFGDWLLQEGKVTKEEYDEKQIEAKSWLGIKAEREKVQV